MEWDIIEKLSKLSDEEILSIAATVPDFYRLFTAIRTIGQGNSGPMLVGTLIDSDNFDVIEHSVSRLKRCPYIQSAFECVLDPDKNRADFSFSIGRISAEAAVTLGNPVADWFGEAEFKGKDRVLRLITRWMDKKSLLYHSIYAIYFELDTSIREKAEIPGLFVRLQSGDKRPEWYETMSLAVLESLDIELTKEKRIFIKNYFTALAEATGYFHLGIMLSRDDFPIKFVAEYTELHKAKSILESLGFDMSRYINEIDWARLVELCDGFAGLSLDFIDKGGGANWIENRIGLEIQSSSKDDELIDWFIGMGCCSAEKGKILRDWKGKVPYRFADSGEEVVICREISHFKLVLRRDLPMQAKVYLEYYPYPL